jgi:hypothetical protein
MPNKTERDIERDKKIDDVKKIVEQILAILTQQGEKIESSKQRSNSNRRK